MGTFGIYGHGIEGERQIVAQALLDLVQQDVIDGNRLIAAVQNQSEGFVAQTARRKILIMPRFVFSSFLSPCLSA